MFKIPDLNDIFLILAYTAHSICIIVWVGTMIFNLIIQFPMNRKRATSSFHYAELMAEQGVNAVKWLLLLFILTFFSGWAIFLLKEGADLFSAENILFLLVKHSAFVVMLISHSVASMNIWPKVFFALDEEIHPLLFKYEMTILSSLTFGILAIVFSFYWFVIYS